MKNKKNVVKATLLSIILLSPIISGSAISMASEIPKQNAISTDNHISSNNPIENYKNSEFFEVSVDGEDTIVSISDSNFKALLDSKGMDSSFIKPSLLKAEGRTTVVWHGAAYKGNVDLYLKKSWLNNIQNFSTGAIITAIGLIFPVSNAYAIAVGGIGATIKSGNFAHGRVFVIRNFDYQYWYYQ